MTAAKMVANRANAQHSTGPQDTTTTRFNGVQHGLTSKQTVIRGESQEEYDAYQERFLKDLSPVSALERTLADRVIAAAWRLQRFARVETAFYNDRINAYRKENPDADEAIAMANLFIDPAEIAKMRLFLRYQTGVQREFDKALSEFRKAQAERQENEVQQAMLEAAQLRNGGFASQGDSKSNPHPFSSAFIRGQNPQHEAPDHHHTELVMKLQSDRPALGPLG